MTATATATARSRPTAAVAASATERTSATAPRSQPTAAVEVHHLAPAQLPGYQAESWTALTAGPVHAVAGHDIELNECATVHGAATWQQQPYMSSGGDFAILETYTFATNAAASTAYGAVVSGMRSCQATSRALQTANKVAADAISRQTASDGDAVAFERTWTGVQGISAAGPQVNHLYLAMRGSTILILHFDELGKQAHPYDVRNDPGVLSTLTSVLAA